MIVLLVCCLVSPASLLASSPDGAKVRSETSLARRSSLNLPHEIPRLSFKFGEITAFVDEQGLASIEGPVKHTRFRCATYQLGLQLGEGKPGCTNVQWITEPVYFTSHKQCNSAVLIHSHAMKVVQFQQVFPTVSCARRLIRCTGVCN